MSSIEGYRTGTFRGALEDIINEILVAVKRSVGFDFQKRVRSTTSKVHVTGKVMQSNAMAAECVDVPFRRLLYHDPDHDFILSVVFISDAAL